MSLTNEGTVMPIVGPKIIDILIVVKVEDIVNKYGGLLSQKINIPTQINDYNKYFHLFSEKGNVYSNEGTGDLVVRADKGSVLRWREVTLTKDALYSAALVKFESMPLHYEVAEEQLKEYFTALTVGHFDNYVPNVKTGSPLLVEIKEVESYFWETTVHKMPFPGTKRQLNYSLTFGIYKEGNFLGYIAMDPGVILDNSINV
ncbi:inclusion body family protein [Xenorhabdus bovienii]|uniref:AidA/PixA family protein n=2 Tax=Xenorhabdus bovienii TaxID=40576 RepID=UPI0023B2640B|nr:AidA/PixA family protein [Xenorhabdus bovienii]MDE9495965.1 inclusion body family protein [Xenorhabdus bovienii]MDE9528093.1 inclusion body family protein [Xenorhabdus bovienii]MDE9571238.1 inclusion body family protein [Xenorhabdus bovienii]